MGSGGVSIAEPSSENSHSSEPLDPCDLESCHLSMSLGMICQSIWYTHSCVFLSFNYTASGVCVCACSMHRVAMYGHHSLRGDAP
jgi:hypothetical protein